MSQVTGKVNETELHALLLFCFKCESMIYNNYSMSPSWIWSDKITNSRYALVGYNRFISNKGVWNNCFSKFSNRVLPPVFISTILQSVNLAHYFPYDVKLRLLAHSRSFLANQKARNAIVGSENLLKFNILKCKFIFAKANPEYSLLRRLSGKATVLNQSLVKSSTLYEIVGKHVI